MCWDGTTHAVTQNAAATCTVSSRRYKHDIETLSCHDANRFAAALRPVTFEYNDGNRPSIGLIAEEADSVDHRFATRDGQGRVNSVNYEMVGVVALRSLQCGSGGSSASTRGAFPSGWWLILTFSLLWMAIFLSVLGLGLVLPRRRRRPEAA